jgi:hypothetical protein
MRIPYVRDTHSTREHMNLPAGRTCGDCNQFQHCAALLSRIKDDEVCDWYPSRFVERISKEPLPSREPI